MKYDYHVHTHLSDDAQTPMETMVQKALALGLNELCFTDHIDYGVKTDDGPPERRNCDCWLYFQELADIRRRFGDKITVKAGMEFGIQPHTIPQFQKIFDMYEFDFIILSNHQVDDLEFWSQDFQKGKTQEEFQRRYYEQIYEVMNLYHDYSILGHLDMIKRYDLVGPYPDEKILDIIERILRLAIKEGKGIEVNTSCYRYQLPDLTPSRKILELYHELGGEILTLGSDAHRPEDLADQIENVKPILRQIGFRSICTFTKMTPEFHAL